MKRNYNKLIFFFTVLLSTFSNAQGFNEYDINKRLQVSDLKLKGSVKSVHEYVRNYNAKYEKDRDFFWQQENIYQFNKKGNAIEIAIKMKEKPYSKVIHNYKKSGNVTTTEYWRYYKKDWRVDTLFIKYNNTNLVFETTTRKGNKTRFIYDKNNNIIEEKIASLKDTVFKTRKKFEYDNRNNLLKVLNYGYYLNNKINNGNLSLTSTLNFKYDNNDNIIEEIRYRGVNKELVYKTTYSYNDIKQVVKTISYNVYSNRASLKNSYSYNKEGELIELKQYYYGTGNSELKTKIYKIEYDEHKNWIKQTVYKEEKPIKIYKRDIIYY